MNLDDLKNAWQQQEQSLQATKKTSEQLLRTILQQRSTHAIGQMLNMEYLSVAVAALVLLVTICTASFFTESPALLTAFVVTVVLLSATLAWEAYKIRFLQGLDFSNGPVTVVAEKLEKFRLLIVKEQLVSLIGAPLLMAALIPLSHRLVHGDSAFQYTGMYAGRLAAGYVVLVIFMLIGYRKYYFRNIQLATQHLAEIKAFCQ